MSDERGQDHPGASSADADATETPLSWRIIQRGPLMLLNDAALANVRPCTHRKFVLDDEYHTCTCADCGAQIAPYAVVRIFADAWDEVRRRAENAEHAEWRALAQQIRGMLEKRAIRDRYPDQQRAQLHTLTHLYGAGALARLRALHTELEGVISAAKQARAAQARRPRLDR